MEIKKMIEINKKSLFYIKFLKKRWKNLKHLKYIHIEYDKWYDNELSHANIRYIKYSYK